jgi:hypothetical protein
MKRIFKIQNHSKKNFMSVLRKMIKSKTRAKTKKYTRKFKP